MTWAKLPAIRANCGIEMTLDECMLELSEMMAMRKQVAGLYRVARAHPQRPSPAAASKLRKRIPSWINLSAMGEPPALGFALSVGQFYDDVHEKPLMRWFALDNHVCWLTQ